jgi:Tfp pilus assembly PilM family ATPase
MDDFKNHAGINISLSKLQLLEVVKKKENFEIININELIFNRPIDFVNEKDTTIAAELQTAFDGIQLNQSLKSTHISFSLPQDIFYTVQLPYENSLPHNDLIEEFRWEISLLYPFVSAEEFVIRYFKMDRNSINKKNMALVIAIEKRHIKLIKNFCLKNNLTLRYIDSAMFAANRLFNSIKDLSKKGFVLNILSSGSSFSFALNHNGKPAYVKIYPLSRNVKVSDILANELLTTILKQVKAELTNEAYISGDEISAELISQLRIASGLNFKQLNPFRNLTVKPEIGNKHLIEENYSAFTSAAGMAFRLA